MQELDVPGVFQLIRYTCNPLVFSEWIISIEYFRFQRRLSSKKVGLVFLPRSHSSFVEEMRLRWHIACFLGSKHCKRIHLLGYEKVLLKTKLHGTTYQIFQSQSKTKIVFYIDNNFKIFYCNFGSLNYRRNLCPEILKIVLIGSCMK